MEWVPKRSGTIDQSGGCCPWRPVRNELGRLSEVRPNGRQADCTVRDKRPHWDAPNWTSHPSVEKEQTIPELVQAVNTLFRKAFPTADESTYNNMGVYNFISALNNDQHEIFVFQWDPQNVEEAGRSAIAYETFQSSKPKTGPPYVWAHRTYKESPKKILRVTHLDWLILWLNWKGASRGVHRVRWPQIWTVPL